MAIPNTTPTPNIIFNGLMAQMTDTEFRVVMVVVRATLGWIVNPQTGMRKEEDWISYYQLKKLTGRGYTALVKAIDNCIKKGWIEARDKDGNLLDTKDKRIGKNIYYRLGKEILLKDDNGDILVKSSQPFQKVKKSGPTFSESEKATFSESEISESEAYKRNTIQKKIITKEEKQETPKRNKPPSIRNKSPHQIIIDYYFSIKDYPEKWCKQNYSRHCRPAKRLLNLTDNNPEEVIKMINKGKEYFEKKKLDWTLETIEKRWNEIKRHKEVRYY